MNIWNKVLIFLICLLGVLATFWSAKVMSNNVKQGAAIKKMEDDRIAALKSIETDNNYEKGVPTWDVRNAALLADRAENWLFCAPKAVEMVQNKHAQIIFTMKPDVISTMKVGDTIYVFDQRPFGQGGKYLGRFSVSQIQGQDTAAVSLDVMTDLEMQNLVSSRNEISQVAAEQIEETNAAWSIFSKCPTDRPDLFANLSDAEKEKYLPEPVRANYARYDQAPESFTSYDFGTLFTHYYQKRIENSAQLAEKQAQEATIAESNRLATQALTDCQNENSQIEKETQQMEEQRKEVKQLLDAKIAECKQMQQKIDELQKDNERKVNEIHQFQQDALRR